MSVVEWFSLDSKATFNRLIRVEFPGNIVNYSDLNIRWTASCTRIQWGRLVLKPFDCQSLTKRLLELLLLYDLWGNWCEIQLSFKADSLNRVHGEFLVIVSSPTVEKWSWRALDKLSFRVIQGFSTAILNEVHDELFILIWRGIPLSTWLFRSYGAFS